MDDNAKVWDPHRLEGMRARIRGEDTMDCPYHANDDRSYAWLSGWNMQDTMLREETPKPSTIVQVITG